MKQQESAIFLKSIIQFLRYSLLTVVLYFLIYLDAIGFLNSNFDEKSFTEWGQEIFIISIVLTFTWIGKKYADKIAMAFLGGGLGTMVLVREYNNFFKANFFQGAWSVLVALLAMLTIWLVYRNRQNLIPAMADFVGNRSFGLVLSGLLVTFVFSRLFGLPYVWQAIMKENYVRPVIRAVEEGSELMGYMLILVGVLEYAISLKDTKAKLAKA